MEDDSEKKPEYITEGAMENSGLVGELAEKISESHTEAIATLSLSIGRMCQIHNFLLDDLYDMIKTGYEMQVEINQYIEEHVDEETKDEEDDNGGEFGSN